MVVIKEIISQFSDDFLSKYSLSTPVEVLWNEFKQMCFKCLAQVPSKLSSTNTKQPWVTSHIKCLSRKKTTTLQLSRALKL